MAVMMPSKYGVFEPCNEYLHHVANIPKVDYKNLEKYEIKYCEWKKRNKITHI
jgi:hypothetical protein